MLVKIPAVAFAMAPSEELCNGKRNRVDTNVCTRRSVRCVWMRLSQVAGTYVTQMFDHHGNKFELLRHQHWHSNHFQSLTYSKSPWGQWSFHTPRHTVNIRNTLILQQLPQHWEHRLHKWGVFSGQKEKIQLTDTNHKKYIKLCTDYVQV